MLAEAEGRGWVNLPSKSSVLLKEKREKLSAVFVKRYVHGETSHVIRGIRLWLAEKWRRHGVVVIGVA